MTQQRSSCPAMSRALRASERASASSSAQAVAMERGPAASTSARAVSRTKSSEPTYAPSTRMPPPRRTTSAGSAERNMARAARSATSSSESPVGKRGAQQHVFLGPYFMVRPMAAMRARMNTNASATAASGPATWTSSQMARMSSSGHRACASSRMGWMPRQNRSEPSVSPCCCPERDLSTRCLPSPPWMTRSDSCV